MVKKKLTILIPAFNEEKTIEKVIRNIPSFLNLNQKVVVVDDGSKDNSAILAQNAGAIVISNKENLGLGKTFKIGLNYSLTHGSDIIVILDADGQYKSKSINKLVLPILNEEADLVIGNRFLSNSIFRISFIKRVTNKILSIFISKILLRLEEIYDVQSSFRAFNKKFGQALTVNLVARYNYAQEMFILSWLKKYNVKQVPINCYKRINKSRLIKNPVIHLVKIIWISLISYFNIKFRI